MLNKKNLVKIIIALSLIFFIALLLRYFAQIDNGRLHFSDDEARDAAIIKNAVEQKEIIYLGPSVSYNDDSRFSYSLGPFYYYLICPAYLIFNFNPLAGALFIIFLSASSIFIIFSLCKKISNEYVGLIAASIFSISNIIIIYSWAWNPNPVPLFVLLLLFFIYLYVSEKKEIYWFISSFILGLLTQLHLFTIFLFPIIIFTCLLSKVKIYTLKNILLFIWAIISSYLFFIVYQFNHNFNEIKDYFKIFSLEHKNTISFWERFYDNLLVFIDFFNKIFFPGADKIFIIILFIIVLYYIFKNINKFISILSIVSLFFIIIICIISKIKILDHYLLFFVPIAIIIVSESINYIWHKNIFGKSISAIILSLILYFNLNSYIIMLKLKEPIYASDISYGNIEETVQYITDDSKNQKFNIVFIRPYVGSNELSYKYLFNLDGIEIDPNADVEYIIIQPKNYTDIKIENQISSQETIGNVKVIKTIKNNKIDD